MVMTGVSDIKVPRIPALTSESVVAVGHAGHVHLLDLDTGQKIWTRALGTVAGASACEGQPVSVVLAENTVVAAAVGHIFALKIADGAVLWHVQHQARGAGETSLSVGTAIGDYVARLES